MHNKVIKIRRRHCEGGPTAHSKNFKTPFLKRYWKILSRGYSNRSRTSPFFFLFKISQQIWSLEASKNLAKMGRGWQADCVGTKTFLSIWHKLVMNKCWKFQEDILILVWVRAKWLKICCNQWTLYGQHYQKWPKRVHWLQQIFSHLALTQTRIKISSWNFQHLVITSLCKFDNKILVLAETACLLQPILAKILDASSNHICWDTSKRKKMVRF